ncbi:hypothetical protein PWR05_35805 [Paraburkholderia sp. A2RI-6]|uniref:hypothetical protein n=1 Tax=Paraburkholderia sp. A2RI-6 TaxID=3028371 RepID=UPI003B7D3AA8
MNCIFVSFSGWLRSYFLLFGTTGIIMQMAFSKGRICLQAARPASFRIRQYRDDRLMHLALPGEAGQW